MPKGAINDWLKLLQRQGRERNAPVSTNLNDRIFHFEVGEGPGIIGKVRTSEGQSREYRDDQGREYIWHRYNREQEFASNDDPRKVVNVTLDVWDISEYRKNQDHFLFLTEEMITSDTYSKGDQKIRIERDGVYEGPLARFVDSWDAIFDYASGQKSLSERKAETGHTYRMGVQYQDRRSEADQFQKWIRGPLETGISNSGGVRAMRAKSGPYEGSITCIAIVSSEADDPEGNNRWNDVFDLENGRIEYWGDAKRERPDEEIDEDTFSGNQQLREIQRYERQDYPPILVFKKPEKGVVEFSGLCVVESVELDEFLDQGVATPNYLFHLGVLDAEEVPVAWIHERTQTGSDRLAPSAWKQWVESGEVTSDIRYGTIDDEAVDIERELEDTSLSEFVRGDTSGTRTQTSREEVRVSQRFKNSVRDAYERCILTDIAHPTLLSVSHILPRSERPDLAEHLGNVVLLNHTHHAAFDAGLWTFNSDGILHINPEFDPEDVWLQNTLKLRDGAEIPALVDAPVNAEFIDERNTGLDWMD